MRFRYPCTRRVALALNGAVAACAFLGNEINPYIGAVKTGLLRCPFRPEPDRGETFLVDKVLQEVRLHQPLEETAFLRFGISD